MGFLRSIIVVAAICFGMSSCISYKKLTDASQYFKNLEDSLLNSEIPNFETIFQKGDILSISVITPNELSSSLFNRPNFITAQTANGDLGASTVGATPTGYLVDEKGYITFPMLGRIKAEGATRAALTDTITKKISAFIDSAIISVRLQNYRITVLGEVAKPGTFSIPSERVTILDAIGLAGDLTIYGKRNTITVIRTVDGKRQSAKLDLNKGDIFRSPYFYLRQNDIVYIPMNDRKIANTDQASLRNISIGIGLISALGVIASIINVLK